MNKKNITHPRTNFNIKLNVNLNRELHTFIESEVAKLAHGLTHVKS